MFVEGGTQIVEIDEQELENQIWLRMAGRAIQAASKMKTGFGSYAIAGTLQEYGQKDNRKNVIQLETAVRFLTKNNIDPIGIVLEQGC